MLEWFAKKSTRFGEKLTPVSATDYPAAYCKVEGEWTALIHGLTAKGLLETSGQEFHISLAGHEHLARMKANHDSRPKDSNMTETPSCFDHLRPDLSRFDADGSYENSVFVMMKFPDHVGMKPAEIDMLDTIFRVIREELDRHGLRARRADDKTFATSKQLWDNLCIYMLGCKYGIAVLEARSGDELNPNIALEYGFMRALGRETALLKERTFKHIRADLVGTIPKEFVIALDLTVDEHSLRGAVEAWMIDLGLPPKRRR